MASPSELWNERRCTGIGWVKLDTDRQKPAQPDGAVRADAAPPEVRCIGRSFQGSCDQRAGWSEVDDHTWAVVCGGTFRMMMHRPSTVAETDPIQPLLWQCEGVSFRIERVPQQHEAPVPSQREAHNAHSNETDIEDVTVESEDVMAHLARGTLAVASRARAIVTFWGSERKSPQSLSPGSFAMDVAKASRRICAQAGKISRRSVEQARQVVFFPLRLYAASGAPKTGQDPS
ncbi:unnamed protein product [Durusdinium trenchii]|uniref:Uncharacterized protein n=2 Tax=Durusdinium trenchii TaxID=1381693 RepID=A0ABP0N6G4_9DINO